MKPFLAFTAFLLAALTASPFVSPAAAETEAVSCTQYPANGVGGLFHMAFDFTARVACISWCAVPGTVDSTETRAIDQVTSSFLVAVFTLSVRGPDLAWTANYAGGALVEGHDAFSLMAATPGSPAVCPPA